MRVIIKDHRFPNSAEVISCPAGTSGNTVVEAWQKGSIHFKVTGRFPACTWKVAESDNFIDAMIESARI